jgi:hypothetical protein
MPENRLKHYAALLFPVLMSIYLYRRSFRIWFLNDDFAWLGLGLGLFNVSDLWHALFSPMAQGTIRTLSERLFFLAFERTFGLESLPMRIFEFAILAVAQILLVLVVKRLSGSLSAGVWASALWSLNFGLSVAMAWLSAFNQILLSALFLGALYCFLRYAESNERKWLAGTWICYLLGFGALESIIVFPAVLLAWALLLDRSKWRLTLPFFAPAILFTAAHLFWIPKAKDAPAYRIFLDLSLFESIAIYWKWLFAAVRIQNFGPDWAWLVTPSNWILTPAVLGFIVWRSWRRDFLPLFGLVMSMALIGPMLPLRDHRTDYYLASASIGIMIVLGVFTIRLPRPASLLLILYIVPSFIVQQATFEWYLERTAPIRPLIRGLQHAVQTHPGKLILVDGITESTYESALADEALRLINAQNIRLVPGSKPAGNPLTVAPETARIAFEKEAVTVYHFNGSILRDVTREWERGRALNLSTGFSPEILAGDPIFNPQFLAGWYGIEDGHRWLSGKGSVRVGGPFAKDAQITLKAYAPASLGSLELKILCAGTLIHTAKINPGDVEIHVPLPQHLQASESLVLDLEASKTVRPPNDGRNLSLVFSLISIR